MGEERAPEFYPNLAIFRHKFETMRSLAITAIDRETRIAVYLAAPFLCRCGVTDQAHN